MTQYQWDSLPKGVRGILKNHYFADKDSAVFQGNRFEVFKTPLGTKNEGEIAVVRLIDGGIFLACSDISNQMTQWFLQAEGEAKNAYHMKEKIDDVAHGVEHAM